MSPEDPAVDLDKSKWRRDFRRGSKIARARLIGELFSLGFDAAPDRAAVCAELAFLGISDRAVDVVGAAIGTIGGLLTASRTVRDGLECRSVLRPPQLLAVARRAVPLLATASKSRWPDNRANAYHSLGALGVVTRTSLAALKRGLRDPEANCRRHAVAALGQLGELPTELVRAVAEMAANPAESPEVRVFAVSVLGQQRRALAANRRVLSRVLQDRRIGSRLRLFTKRALEQLDPARANRAREAGRRTRG